MQLWPTFWHCKTLLSTKSTQETLLFCFFFFFLNCSNQTLYILGKNFAIEQQSQSKGCFSILLSYATSQPQPPLPPVIQVSLHLPLPQIYGSSISLQEKAGLPGISNKLGITWYNKTRHKPSHQGWKRQPSRRKRVSKESEMPPLLLLGYPQNSKLSNHNIYVENLAGPRLVSSISDCCVLWALLLIGGGGGGLYSSVLISSDSDNPSSVAFPDLEVKYH